MTASTEREKQVAAKAGAALVSEGMRVGLGTGSTVERLLPVLAGRALKDVVYVATSPQTEHAARELGLDIRPFTRFDRLDLAIDGADQIAPTGWLVKGGGGAHTREKVVAAARVPEEREAEAAAAVAADRAGNEDDDGSPPDGDA